jgi:hypothetical protein
MAARMTVQLGLLGAGALAAVVLIALVIWLRSVRSEVKAVEGEPFLVPWGEETLPIEGAPQVPPRRFPSRPRPLPPYGAPPQVAGAGAPPPPGDRSAASSRTPEASVPPAESLSAALSRPTPDRPVVSLAGGLQSFLVSEPIHPSRPRFDPDAASPFLPGHLELTAQSGRPEIRFPRQPGARAEITLGRREGPPSLHVRLDAPTVSRLHARMSFADGRWAIANLSATNPVQVNGRRLGGAAEPQRLADGDVIQIGEVRLVFRED